MQFPVQKLYSWAPVCGRDTWDNPGWCSRDTRYCVCSKGQGGSVTRFGKTSLFPCVGGVEDTANLSADNLSVRLTFPNFSHFTTFQKAEEIRKKRKKTTHSPTTIWRLETSKHKILAGTVLAATKTDIPLPLLLF